MRDLRCTTRERGVRADCLDGGLRFGRCRLDRSPSSTVEELLEGTREVDYLGRRWWVWEPRSSCRRRGA